MAQVFISYSRKDLDFVDELAADLRKAGLEVWYDVSKLGGGSRWRTEIENALQNSQYVIVVLSPDSIQSEWVEREFLFSSNLKLKIIPLMYRTCKLPLNYVNLNYIDARGDEYVQNFSKILSALDVQPDKEKMPSKRPGRIKTQSMFMIGAGTIVIAALLVLSLMRNGFAPVSTPTAAKEVTPKVPTATESFTPEPTDEMVASPVPTHSPAPTATDMPTWQQGKIVFIARNTEKVYFLYIQNLASGQPPQILLSPDRPDQTRYYSPWFAPDGQVLAYTDRYTGKLFVMDPAKGNSSRPIGTCSSPSFSRDGTKVICEVDGADYFPIYEVATGRQVDEVRHGKSSGVLPAWSPNGTEIAFSHLDENRDASLWKVSASGGSASPLATSASEDYAPAWSPDGEWIAYQSTQNSERSEIWIMRRDGSEKRQITFSGGGENWSRGPSFSPDGKWLAFVSNQDQSDGPDFGEVFVISLTTWELQQVTNTDGRVYDWRVTWAK